MRLITLLLFCLSLFARDTLNGTTELIVFKKIPADATVTFEHKNLIVQTHPTDPKRHFVLVPIAYRSKLGDYTLTVNYPSGSQSIPLHVSQGDYASEQISVAPSKAAPDATQQERTRREYAEAMRIYNTITPKRYWHKPFVVPMSSAITSPFGTARLFNGHLKSFHSGTDFRAKTGTPVTATNDGVVVLAKERFYAGGSVIVDHGEGLYSCYYHLSALHVKPGDTVTQAQELGLSGATGRVSGPHLHYAMMLQGVQVDPLQLHDVINSLF